MFKLRFDDAAFALLRLDEPHAELVQEVVDEARFLRAEIPLRLLLQERDQLDHLGGGNQVRLHPLAGARIGDVAEVHGRGRGKRKNEATERDPLRFGILHHGMLA